MPDAPHCPLSFTCEGDVWFLNATAGGITVTVPLTLKILHHLYVESGMLLQRNIKEPSDERSPL